MIGTHLCCTCLCMNTHVFTCAQAQVLQGGMQILLELIRKQWSDTNIIRKLTLASQNIFGSLTPENKFSYTHKADLWLLRPLVCCTITSWNQVSLLILHPLCLNCLSVILKSMKLPDRLAVTSLKLPWRLSPHLINNEFISPIKSALDQVET